jgi:hypothetical protein
MPKGFTNLHGTSRMELIGDGMERMKTAVQAIPVNLKKNTLQSAGKSIGGINSRAKANFEAIVKRPGETGEGKERGRQTGNFTFGRKGVAGVAFSGNTFEHSKGVFGFGYPNISQADKKTNYVWRSLEYGLAGIHHKPTSFFANPSFPQGEHKLPKRFYFTSGSPTNSKFRVAKKYSRKGRQGQTLLKSPPIEPGGIEGKHFIESAWLDYLAINENKWEADVVATRREFGGK